MSPVETRASSIPIKSLSPRSSLSVDDAIGFGTLLPVPLSEIRISPLRRSLAEIFHFLVVPGHACAAAAFVLKLQASSLMVTFLSASTANRLSNEYHHGLDSGSSSPAHCYSSSTAQER